MKKMNGILVLAAMMFFTACSSTPYNPNKPEMSVPENSTYKTPPRTFNQFHENWDY
jgi:major membrane immunogen (membrane-anchored lipoprotein)